MRRIDQVRAADFGVPGGAQFRDDQIAEIVREEEPIAVLHHEDVGPIGGAFARRGLVGIPEPPAILEPGAEEPAAVSTAIDTAVLNERSVHRAVDAAAGVALPGHLGGQTVFRHAQAPRLAAEAHDENGIPLGDWRCDGHAESRLQRHTPIDRASFRMERVDGFAVPDDDLPFPPYVEDRWRTITGFLGVERSPEFPSRLPIERHRSRALAAHDADQLVTIDQGMRGETPHRHFDSEVLLKITRPDHFAGFGVEAEEMPFRTQRVNASVGDRRRDARAGGVVTRGRVGAVVIVGPKNPAVGLIKTNHPLRARQEPTFEVGVDR